MKKKSIFLTILCLIHMGLAYSWGEMIMVQSKFHGGIYSFQYTVNKQRNYVCTGGSQYCPNRMFISIDPNKDNIFNLYSYEGSGYYTINESCRNQIINVKPNSGATITIVRNNREIVCNYIK